MELQDIAKRLREVGASRGMTESELARQLIACSREAGQCVDRLKRVFDAVRDNGRQCFFNVVGDQNFTLPGGTQSFVSEQKEFAYCFAWWLSIGMMKFCWLNPGLAPEDVMPALDCLKLFEHEYDASLHPYQNHAMQWAELADWMHARELEYAQAVATYEASKAQNAPTPTPEELDWRTPGWFEKVTDGALYTGLLKTARLKGRLSGRKVGQRYQYRIAVVIALYPNYASKILARRNEPEPGGTKRNRTGKPA